MIRFCLIIWKQFMFCLNMNKNSAHQTSKVKYAKQGARTRDLSETEEMEEKAA
jgi:hypothetical protein